MEWSSQLILAAEEEAPGEGDEMPDCFCEEMGDWGYLCCFFECPGWDDYLSFLTDDVVGDLSIPNSLEPPEWDVPDIPNIFDTLNSVDERNPAKPTGDNAPGLDDASFDAEDLKMDAGEIEFREDPTGGFDITNPLESLPEDGSTAPRPENEFVPFPQNGGAGTSEGNGTAAFPSTGGNGTAAFPDDPGGTAVPPSTNDWAAFPVP